jgi:hypothetical protein
MLDFYMMMLVTQRLSFQLVLSSAPHVTAISTRMGPMSLCRSFILALFTLAGFALPGNFGFSSIAMKL